MAPTGRPAPPPVPTGPRCGGGRMATGFACERARRGRRHPATPPPLRPIPEVGREELLSHTLRNRGAAACAGPAHRRAENLEAASSADAPGPRGTHPACRTRREDAPQKASRAGNTPPPPAGPPRWAMPRPVRAVDGSPGGMDARPACVVRRLSVRVNHLVGCGGVPPFAKHNTTRGCAPAGAGFTGSLRENPPRPVAKGRIVQTGFFKKTTGANSERVGEARAQHWTKDGTWRALVGLACPFARDLPAHQWRGRGGHSRLSLSHHAAIQRTVYCVP